jgi:hypothetical protein
VIALEVDMSIKTDAHTPFGDAALAEKSALEAEYAPLS